MAIIAYCLIVDMNNDHFNLSFTVEIHDVVFFFLICRYGRTLVNQEEWGKPGKKETLINSECEFDLCHPGTIDRLKHVLPFLFMGSAVNSEHVDSQPAANLV